MEKNLVMKVGTSALAALFVTLCFYQYYFPYGLHFHSTYRQTRYNAALVGRALKLYSIDNDGIFPPPPLSVAENALISGSYCSASDFESYNPKGGRIIISNSILGKHHDDKTIGPSEILVYDEFKWSNKPDISIKVSQLKY